MQHLVSLVTTQKLNSCYRQTSWSCLHCTGSAAEHEPDAAVLPDLHPDRQLKIKNI